LDYAGQFGSEPFYDKDSTSAWIVYSLSQFISYDDAQSFGDKTNFLMQRCLRGFAIWSLDLDTQDLQALTALVGEDAMDAAIIEDQVSA
jgi:GH18 family chitinase